MSVSNSHHLTFLNLMKCGSEPTCKVGKKVCLSHCREGIPFLGSYEHPEASDYEVHPGQAVSRVFPLETPGSWVGGGFEGCWEQPPPFGSERPLCPDWMGELPTGESTWYCSRMCVIEEIIGKH